MKMTLFAALAAIGMAVRKTRNKPLLIMGKHRKKEIGLIIRKQKSGKLYEDEVMRMTSSFCFLGDYASRPLQ